MDPSDLIFIWLPWIFLSAASENSLKDFPHQLSEEANISLMCFPAPLLSCSEPT